MHYQADSALYYINLKQNYLQQGSFSSETDEIHINRAEVYGVIGMYNEALAELKKINISKIKENQPLYAYYLQTYRACYGWLADYTAEEKTGNSHERQVDHYRDSIASLHLQNADYTINKAEMMLYHGHPSEAIDLLKPLLNDTISLKHQAYANYFISEAFGILGDTIHQIKYLIHTSLLDIKMAEREYASLQKLALLMYQTGQIDRAYRYLTCSMEDAVAANARLRFLEVTQIYPIIDRAYEAMKAKEKKTSRNLLISLSLLAVLLIFTSFYLYYWMKKLSVMRKDLYTANQQLLKANKNLLETGKIKEMYITKYLDKCVNYLEKLEQYRRSLEKLAMASKTNELFKAIKSEEFLHNERKAFYQEFDKSFLDLFPNFIHDFNQLLQEEASIFPKKEEQLTTELRIFALIRLGVTDANHIAHFLGYSLATVYNYRSKIRNKAKGNKDTFEQEVMNL
ncbi:regulatory protein SusR [gut metagenome]|uniref:Regulatory protein SusR n=1 Tax=gut metagenome TaxID=749906 RepID=J9F509_9ZZZZ